MAKNIKGPLEIYDFVLHRDNGTGIRLHPGWSDRKIETYDVAGHQDQVQPPKKGGPGTMRELINRGNQMTLRFRGQVDNSMQ